MAASRLDAEKERVFKARGAAEAERRRSGVGEIVGTVMFGDDWETRIVEG